MVKQEDCGIPGDGYKPRSRVLTLTWFTPFEMWKTSLHLTQENKPLWESMMLGHWEGILSGTKRHEQGWGVCNHTFGNLLKCCWYYCSVQFSSVAQSCPILCDPMNCSTPGLPVHHKLLESAQTHAHWVGDAIQPSHPLSSPSPPAPNPSPHQGLFQCVNSPHQVAKVLEFQLQHQSFQWTPRTDFL